MRGSRVLYCHGLESGPNGYKVRALREQGLEVIAPALQMSLWNPACKNSLLRSLLSPSAVFGRAPTRWLARAMDDSFQACIDVMRSAAAAPSGSPSACTVLVGSSWGGAVATALVAEGSWVGPAVLLCPALHIKERWAGGGDAALSADVITARLASLPMERKRSLLLVHGTADDTVPVDDSRALSEATGIALELIDGGSHGLGAIIGDGRLVEFMRRVAPTPAWESVSFAGEATSAAARL